MGQNNLNLFNHNKTNEYRKDSNNCLSTLIHLNTRTVVTEAPANEEAEDDHIKHFGIVTQIKEEKFWRIWYGKEDSDNPLIDPCNCLGSMKYIHYSWVKAWIEEQLVIDTSKQNVKSFWWKRVSWELWKAHFSDTVTKDNKILSLFESEKEDLVLKMELVNSEDIKMTIWVYSDNREIINNLRIGRSSLSDIKINMDTVSRIHAELFNENNEFYIKDIESTYGTMILLKDPIVFSNIPKNEVWLQTGSTLVEIKYGSKKSIEKQTKVNNGYEK